MLRLVEGKGTGELFMISPDLDAGDDKDFIHCVVFILSGCFNKDLKCDHFFSVICFSTLFLSPRH